MHFTGESWVRQWHELPVFDYNPGALMKSALK